MFEQYPTAAKTAPEDMFASVDKGGVRQTTPAAYQPPTIKTPAAVFNDGQNYNMPTMDEHGGNSLKYLIIGLATLVVLLGGAWFFYSYVLVPKLAPKIEPSADLTAAQNQTPSEAVTPPAAIANNNLDIVTSSSPSSTLISLDSPVPSSTVSSTATAIDPSLDSDHDGLTNVEEMKLGTNPYAADTDNDGLSDYDEVKVWHTDPLNPDTDGDGFKDGQEVKSGYNPNGPGKLKVTK